MESCVAVNKASRKSLLRKINLTIPVNSKQATVNERNGKLHNLRTQDEDAETGKQGPRGRGPEIGLVYYGPTERLAGEAIWAWAAGECCGCGVWHCGRVDAAKEERRPRAHSGLGRTWSSEGVGGSDRAAEGRTRGPETNERDGSMWSGPAHKRAEAQRRPPRAEVTPRGPLGAGRNGGLVIRVVPCPRHNVIGLEAPSVPGECWVVLWWVSFGEKQKRGEHDREGERRSVASSWICESPEPL
ncbi:hypothetical protein NDU88_000474 [Pleurodeles waltl]|uniref:Uncharacterized protein n=1 Tax=Pleurodeles waltl TaxID=8319 RepID=A0AAV7TFK7_PLEWA|nr:hypothetical protein NDU88_000474 [Pleurodeles waltl]